MWRAGLLMAVWVAVAWAQDSQLYIRNRPVPALVAQDQLSRYFQSAELERVRIEGGAVLVNGERAANLQGELVPVLELARALGFRVVKDPKSGLTDLIPPTAGAGGSDLRLSPEEIQLGKLLEAARPGLRWNGTLARVARRKAQDMAQRNYYGHVDPDRFPVSFYLRQAGYPLPAWADTRGYACESLAAAFPNAWGVWEAWTHDRRYREHVLGETPFYATHKDYGIGHAYQANSRYGHYWVLLTAAPERN